MLGSPLMHSSHQINTMFAILGANFAFSNEDLQLFIIMSRFAVFTGYLFAGLNKLISGSYLNGSILEPYFKDKLPWVSNTPHVLKIIILSVPLIELILAFAVIANVKFTWITICGVHLGMAILLAHGPAHFIELCIFGSLMLFGTIPFRPKLHSDFMHRKYLKDST